MESVSQRFPAEIDPEVYRDRYPDLAHLSPAELVDHFQTYGVHEGRCASEVDGRRAFFDLIDLSASVLEIGPFNNPAVRTVNTRYFDTLSTESLRARARSIGIDATTIPDIHWVSPIGDLTVIDQKFDVCVSSHSIEHQPDLVKHLNDVANLLNPGGIYAMAIPDKRFTFDHFLNESHIGEVLDAHLNGRTLHTLKSVIEHRAFTTHNDPVAHWNGEHGSMGGELQRVLGAMKEFESTPGYIDVHAWIFTPWNFRNIMKVLNDIGLTPLVVESIYPTVRGSNEFYVILNTGHTQTSI